jgi:hypothetical protein
MSSMIGGDVGFRIKKSRWSESNRRQDAYEASTLPLSYTGLSGGSYYPPEHRKLYSSCIPTVKHLFGLTRVCELLLGHPQKK